MPLDVTLLSRRIAYPPDPLLVTLPGGAEISAQIASLGIPDGATMAKSLLMQVNSALAPLMPIFRLMDLGLVVVDTLKAVPQILVNPSALVELLIDVVKKADKVIGLLPPASIPLLVVQVIDALLAYLQGMEEFLQALVEFQEKIADAQAQAATYPTLQIVIDAANDNLTVQMDTLSESMGPLGTLIRVLNALMSLAGLPELPTVDSLGTDPAAALGPLRTAVVELRRVRSLIPV